MSDRFDRRKRRKRRNVVVPIASMGDIAFLLIIFFMVCSNFAKENANYDPPRAIEIDQLENSHVVVTIDEDGVTYLNGAEVGSADALEAGVASLLELRSDQEPIVMFKCHRELSKDVFEPMLDAIASAGGMIAAVGDKQAINNN